MIKFFERRRALQPFIIFAHARSSSTRLIKTLQQHPDIHCAGEIFNINSDHAQRNYILPLFGKTLFESKWTPDEFLWKFYNKSAACTGKRIVGFKIFCDHQPTDIQKRWVLDHRIKKILLFRRNMLQATLSKEIAAQTNQYQNLKHKGGELMLPQPFTANIQNMRKWILPNTAWLQECRELLRASGQEYYECAYEDFSPQITKEIFEYLGVEPISEFRRQHQKMAQREHYDRIQNLDEVRAVLEGPKFGYVDEQIGEQAW